MPPGHIRSEDPGTWIQVRMVQNKSGLPQVTNSGTCDVLLCGSGEGLRSEEVTSVHSEEQAACCRDNASVRSCEQTKFNDAHMTR